MSEEDDVNLPRVLIDAMKENKREKILSTYYLGFKIKVIVSHNTWFLLKVYLLVESYENQSNEPNFSSITEEVNVWGYDQVSSGVIDGVRVPNTYGALLRKVDL